MVSNKILAFLVLFTMSLTVVSTLVTLNRLSSSPEELTARATTGQGNVSLTVANTISIIMNTDAVDFGSGYVNTSNPGCANNATLKAEHVFNDSNGVDCWTAAETPGPLLIENDGNRNVTITVIGPNETTFFTDYVGSYEYNLTWKLRNNESGSCDEIPAGADSYHTFIGASQSVCTNMDHQPSSSDEIAIDVEIKIPADLDPGTYENSTITFTAAEAS